jgi:hypothetical protein
LLIFKVHPLCNFNQYTDKSRVWRDLNASIYL